MSKMSRLIYLLTIFISIVLISCKNNKNYEKPSILAGFKDGTFFDVHLLVYPDSTYYYSNFENGKIGKWEKHKDTLILKKKGLTQAILVDYEPTQINNPRLNWLRNMRFIENNPPKTVNFPNHK